MWTSDTVKNELFASFQLYSEVKAYGKELLKINGHSSPAKTYLQFQAYVRQAKVFYEAADNLHHRASPLLYYYSFMNFAKAYSVLRDPSFLDNGLTHGLSYAFDSGPIRKQSISIKQHGVFPQFYKHVVGDTVANGDKLNIAMVLSYVTDVALEFATLKLGIQRWIPGRMAIAYNNTHSYAALMFWSQIAGSNFQRLKKDFLSDFDEVSLSNRDAGKLFELGPEMVGACTFFESKKLYPNLGFVPMDKITRETITSLGKSFAQFPFDDEEQFHVKLPIKMPAMRTFHEILAIYCMMFYLGSLVRYRPQFLESLLETKGAWIIERFIKQAPVTFLRHLRNALDGSYRAVQSR